MVRSIWSELGELLLAIAAVVGILVVVVKILEFLFGKPEPDLKVVVLEQGRQIERLTGRNTQLTNEKARLIGKVAKLQEKARWWRRIKECISECISKIASRLLAALLERLFLLLMRFGVAALA